MLGGITIANNLDGNWAFDLIWASTLPVTAISFVGRVAAAEEFRAPWPSTLKWKSLFNVTFWVIDLEISEPTAVVCFLWWKTLLSAVDMAVVSLVGSITHAFLDWAFVARPLRWRGNRGPAFWIKSSKVIWIFAVFFFDLLWASSWSLTSTLPVAAVSNVFIVTTAEPFWALVASGLLWFDLISEAFWILNLDVVEISALMFDHSLWTIGWWIDDAAVAFPITTFRNVLLVTLERFLWTLSASPVSNWEADTFWEEFMNLSFPSSHGISWSRALNSVSAVANDLVPLLAVISGLAFTDAFVTLESVRSDVEWNVDLPHD